MALTKFSQLVIGIGIVAGAGFGASYMADSPYVDQALAKLNEKSSQVIEQQKQAEIAKQQAAQEAAEQQRLQAEQTAKIKQAEQERQKAFEIQKAQRIENERLQLEAASKKQIEPQVKQIVLPAEVKQHIIDERNNVVQPQPVEKQQVDPAMAKLLGQSK